MNPFYFTGPAFLALYLIIGIIVLITMYLWFDLSQQSKKVIVSGVRNDPYQIAYLRNGEIGAIEVAVFSLVDRKLLLHVENTVQRKELISTDSVNRPIEKALLEFFNTAKPWREALNSNTVLSACEKYRKELDAQGLIKNTQILKKQKQITFFIIFGFIGISALKVFIAISNGHSNVLFLIFLTFIFCFITGLIGGQRLTIEGKREISHLKSLFAGLYRRANKLLAGGQTNEATLLAAVFGLKSIPEIRFPFVKYFKPNPSAGSSCSAGCSGSSCSGGCGGGGCGGCGGD